MGILDIFEITRPTSSDEKNKPEKRNYKHSDKEKMPTSKKEYKKQKEEQER